jgi:1-deoxy-D-xylulose-5-phosphate reductoisomerase
MKNRLALLGSTGSIGTSALDVIRHHPERLELVTLAAHGSDLEGLEAQIREFRPHAVAVFDPEKAVALAARVGGRTRIVAGPEGLLEVATLAEVDLLLAAVVGAAGLPAVYAALAAGKDVALANKESLVVAGGLLTRLAKQNNARILPVDSEHVALHQALRSGASTEVRRLMLTASGGPFRTRDLSTWDEIDRQQALAHPTWEMGAKISIDSATLMNKGLELIEASHLFEIPAERIDAVVHPQSIVHSLVEFCDGSWIAQLSVNEMIFPIQYALAFPDRWENDFPRLEPEQLGRLEFEPLDHEKFPAVDLAREALAMEDSGPAVLNAANEIAVHAFLEDRIPFVRIVPLVGEVLRSHEPATVTSLAGALSWDRWGRDRALELLSSKEK